MSQSAKSNDKTEHRYASERLSAYLDRQLPPQERMRVEHHLARCPQCQWEFSTMRATVQWTRELPTIPVPRDFTVPVPVRPVRVAQRVWALPLLQGATALVALLFLVAVIGELFLPQFFPALGAHRPAPEAPAAVELTEIVELQMAAPAETLPPALKTEPTRAAVGEAVVQATVEVEVAVEHTDEVAAASVPSGEAALPPTAPLLAEEALPTEAVADSAALKALPPVAAATATPEVGIMRSAGAGSGPETPSPGAMQPETPTAVAVEPASPTALPSPTPFPTTVPAPTALAEVQADEPATAAQVEQPPQAVRAFRTPARAWLSLAVMGLGIAFVLLGSITVLLMVRRLRAH